MIMLRYYRKGQKYPYYFHPEIKTWHELMQFAAENQDVDVEGLDNAEYEMVLSHEEQDSYWIETIRRVMQDTRWVLDHLDEMPIYKVRWNHNGCVSGKYKKKLCVGLPPEGITSYCDRYYNTKYAKAL